ncbi:MAG: M23 family metallopeptidase [Clostridia bacterium]|nr:M23 family metallopeptidase [Clostridia bacterium]
MKNEILTAERYCVSDIPRSLKGQKAESTPAEEKKKSTAPRDFLFTRADMWICALFFSCALLLGVLASLPISRADGEGGPIGKLVLAVYGKLDTDSVAVNAEPEEKTDESTQNGEKISYISVSAEDYIASPPERELVFTGVLPIENGNIISGFSYRDNPLYPYAESARYEFHGGIDIPAVSGTPVLAFADGTVTESGESYTYGIYMIVEHSGRYSSLYAHLSKALRGTGAEVKRGEQIGESGASGRVTGAHLHFELRKDGEPVDPEDYIK